MVEEFSIDGDFFSPHVFDKILLPDGDIPVLAGNEFRVVTPPPKQPRRVL